MINRARLDQGLPRGRPGPVGPVEAADTLVADRGTVADFAVAAAVAEVVRPAPAPS